MTRRTKNNEYTSICSNKTQEEHEPKKQIKFGENMRPHKTVIAQHNIMRDRASTQFLATAISRRFTCCEVQSLLCGVGTSSKDIIS